MTRDTYLDRFLSEKIRKRYLKEQAKRTPSGKLAASRLGWPVQWLILKSLGVPEPEPDDYTLRKFQRGKDVEKWFMSHFPKKMGKQTAHEYRGVVGYSDSIIDTSNWDNPSGVIPCEIKSVTKLKFDHCKKEGAQLDHKLQNCLYAMAEGKRKYAMTYINADDYRVLTFIYDVEELEERVNAIIDRFNVAKVSGVVPPFEATEKWQESPKYNKYYQFKDLSSVDAMELAKKLIEIK